MNLCYIQARGGSKRFPGKNTADWFGTPLLVDAIQKAKDTNIFDIVAVTSDDLHILRMASNAGALPILRSSEASDDSATDDDVAKETLKYFTGLEKVCKLYPCVPLLTPEQIIEAMDYSFPGVYSIDGNGKDAGAFYIFEYWTFLSYGTISLTGFPWKKMVIKNAIDINFPEDLEKAKRMALDENTW